MTIFNDEFEWDEAKAQSNLRRHRISFPQGCRVFDDLFALIERDLSEDYGEDRFLATATVDGMILTVVYTERRERSGIISAPKATTDDQRKYYRAHTASRPDTCSSAPCAPAAPVSTPR